MLTVLSFAPPLDCSSLLAGKATSEGTPADVDQEVVVGFFAYDETSSWYHEYNVKVRRWQLACSCSQLSDSSTGSCVLVGWRYCTIY